MLFKINRQTAIDKFPYLPLREYNRKKEEYDFNYPKVFANYVLTVSSKSYKGHIKLLGIELVSLVINLEFDKLVFLGDEKMAWRYRDHDGKAAKDALQYLANNKIGKRFNGAIQVDNMQLPVFIQQLSWLVRTNAVLPIIHFIDPGQHIIGNICQYENLHIATKTKTADKKFKEAVAKSRFEYFTDESCYTKFSKKKVY